MKTQEEQRDEAMKYALEFIDMYTAAGVPIPAKFGDRETMARVMVKFAEMPMSLGSALDSIYQVPTTEPEFYERTNA